MKQRPSLLIVCITLVPDRSPERQDLSEQFFWQIGSEEASEEQFFAQTAGPARPGPFASAERPQSDQLVALPDVLFPRPAREAQLGRSVNTVKPEGFAQNAQNGAGKT